MAQLIMSDLALSAARKAALIDVFTGEAFPLAHGDNIIGRESSKHSFATKLPLRIGEVEGMISRTQATVTLYRNFLLTHFPT